LCPLCVPPAVVPGSADAPRNHNPRVGGSSPSSGMRSACKWPPSVPPDTRNTSALAAPQIGRRQGPWSTWPSSAPTWRGRSGADYGSTRGSLRLAASWCPARVGAVPLAFVRRTTSPASSVREDSDSFAKMCRRWVCTVRGDTNSRLATCGLESPSATSAATGARFASGCPIPRRAAGGVRAAAAYAEAKQCRLGVRHPAPGLELLVASEGSLELCERLLSASDAHERAGCLLLRQCELERPRGI
jgi:hypothetical protein